uniref:DUF5668 domain-containing protein n=1 Tax=Panagrellus redivivus TaxID=6233 RepID=A0A7E4WBQ0_PANRE
MTFSRPQTPREALGNMALSMVIWITGQCCAHWINLVDIWRLIAVFLLGLAVVELVCDEAKPVKPKPKRNRLPFE